MWRCIMKNLPPEKTMSEENDYKNGLLQIEGTPSGYKSWVDYSRRMKPKDVNDVDWDLFFRKYYGFIISICRNHMKEYDKSMKNNHWHLTDEQTQDIIGEVFNKMYKGARLDYDKSKGSFHAWFASIIANTIKSYLKKMYAQKEGYDKDGNRIIVSSEDLQLEDEETLSPLELIMDLNEEDYMAMLAWEDACEKSKPRQRQIFTWNHEGAKPSEIAKILGMDSKEVSEQIRQFKDKLANAYNALGKTLDAEKIDMADIIQRAKQARPKYDAIVNDYLKKSAENENRRQN